MSKIQYKYRRTIKKAEFVHADLEYHKEVVEEAKSEFKDAIAKLVGRLHPDDREKIKENDKKLKAQKQSKNPLGIAAPSNECFELIPSSTKDSDEGGPTQLIKSKELKTLFHRIAEETHPDKVRANGFSEKEISKRTRIFKSANEAFKEGNWYVLHSIAGDLGISIPPPTEQLIKWIEDDISEVEKKIAIIKNLTAWHWYVGNARAKRLALNHFFVRVYGFNHPELQRL